MQEVFVFPVSFAQSRLWIIDQLAPRSPTYNIPLRIGIRGALDVITLEQSLNDVIQRHEVLRTTFTTQDGQPIQVIAPTLELKLLEIDLERIPSDARESHAEKLAFEDAGRPFDLVRGPLLRASLVRMSALETVLLITVHHIVFDGWSIGILNRELAEFYGARINHRPPNLPELPIQYADYAVWQRAYLQGEVLNEQLTYWRDQLAGVPTFLALPTDRPRPAVQTFQGDSVDMVLPPDLVAALKDFSQREGATLFMTLLAGFQVLLSRYSGQDDIVVGTPVAGRTRAELEGLIGFFVNTLPLRTRLDGNPSFRELLHRVRDVALGAYAHQDLPFEKLVEELRPERSASHTPVVQVSLALDNVPQQELLFQELAVQPLRRLSAASRYDLSITLRDTTDHLAGRVEYSTDLFDRGTISRMIDHFRTLLDGLVTNPECPVGEVPLLMDEEKHLVVEEWNATSKDYPRDQCVHQLFTIQAAQTPDALAVACGREELTYGELEQRANQLARYLQRLGVGPEVLVGVYLERSTDWVIGVLGILKAGGVHVCLDPSYPAERLEFMLKDAAPLVLVTQARFQTKLPPTSRQVVRLDDDWPVIGLEATEAFEAGTTLGNAAYVTYTSGSSGVPKAVVTLHRGLLNLVFWTHRTFSVSPSDRAMQTCHFSLDGSNWELWSYLTTGASIHIVDNETRFSAIAIRDWIIERRITMGFLAPVLAESIIIDDWPSETRLRVLMSGSDRLVVYPREGLPFIYVNLYGPTECTVFQTAAVVSPIREAESPPSIGRPLSNLHTYVLDPHMQPMPIGVPGELYLGGEGLARGYLNRPELTAEKFVPDPFTAASGARLYRTGDLVRWRPDGQLEFFGRLDNQVKIRGFRIELGEVEAVLTQHPAVREAVVLAREYGSGRKRLVAYATPATGDATLALNITDLRMFLAAKLPDYMLPAAFVLLEKLPLSPQGKVDRQALPMPDETRPTVGAAYIAPHTPLEETLAALWAEILGVEHVGVHDNFFELGGDSILAIRVIARANELALGLTPRQVFQHQTVSELAAVARTSKPIEAEQGIVTGAVPLTPIQAWFLEQDFTEPHHWNQAVLFQVREKVDRALLESAVYHLLHHHDALRLRFVPSPSGWQQFEIGDDVPVPLAIVDLSTLAGDERRRALRTTASLYQTGLNLTAGPLIQMVLFDFGSDEPARLLIIAHHLVIDNVSWGILRDDLETAYRQLKCGETVRLPPKTTSFQVWARRLHALPQSPDLQSELTYWLSGKRHQVQPLPLDCVAGKDANTVASARTVSISLSAAETRVLLQRVPSVYQTQINDVLLAALVEAFAQWTSHRSLLIAVEGHGREILFDDVDLSRTVGWFASSFPVWLDLKGIEAPQEVLRSVRDQLRTVPRRGIGYGVLRYLSPDNVREQFQTLPWAEVSFNYVGQSPTSLTATSLFEPARESAGLLRSPLGLRPYLIEISAMVARGRFHIRWRFSKAFHKSSTIERLAQAFLATLRRFIADCQLPMATGRMLSNFPLAQLDQPTLNRLLEGGSRVEDIYPLSPIQQGMLFQSLYAPGSGVYVEHWLRVFEEPLVATAFRRAWQRMMDRHTVFRTAFIWEGLEEPLQVVQREVSLPWEEYDWRGLSPTEQESRLTTYLAGDQQRGFDLSRAPLMRVALIRLAEDRYQCVWTVHHLLLDGWSIPIVLREMFAYYDAFRQGMDIHIEQPRPYRDYIQWLQQQGRQNAEIFWREKLVGFAAPTRVAVEREEPPEAQASGKVEAQEMTVPSDSTRVLRAFVRQHRLTLNTLVQGAWALLLSRYSGETDVLFGTVVSGRGADLAGIESMAGLLMNTLPVRVHVSSDAQALPWLKQLQEDQSEARQYEHSSLLDVQSWSQIPHGVPLFETVLVFENYPDFGETGSEKRGEAVDRIRIRSFEQTHYPLTVLVFPGTELVMRISYDTSRFDAVTIARMLGHFRTLLEGIVANPVEVLTALPLLTMAERQQILYAWNNTRRDFDWHVGLTQQFEAQVERTPEAVAFICDDRHLTYRELNLRANIVASRLRALGVGLEVFVGLCMERSLEMPIGLLGILKSGGVYVPLDPDYPGERLAIMIGDTQPPVIVTQRHLADRLPKLSVQLIYLDDDNRDTTSTENVASGTTAENLAYVMYTSGSTGRPKGSALGHKQLLNRFAWMWEAYPFTADDVICQKTSLNFVDSVWELLGPLLKGVPTVIVPDAVYKDTDAFIEALAYHKVTRVWLLPSVLAQLLSYPDLAVRLPRLKHWVMGGEVLSAELVQQFHHNLPDRLLINLYGSSELFDATACDVAENSCSRTHAPIGKPIANTQTYVLDANLQPVPIGVAGELHVGGACLPRGYINRPELTATRFIPNPFSDTPGARLFKTGDLARFRADGTLECLGRLDHQVKLRGYRIELGEIEAVIAQHPHIRKTVVMLRENDSRVPYLTAYLIVAPDQGISAGEVRQFLKEWLPDYMIPTSYVCVEIFPLTPSGKIDRRALPPPTLADRPTLDTAFIEPRSSTERILAAIFAGLLHVARVGVDDNFFDLGGHSLLALRVISRVREELQVELPIRALFDAPTVALLAQHVAEATSAALVIPRRSRTVVPHLSFAQQRLWFLDQLYPGTTNYNLHTAFRLEGILDTAALEDSLKDMQVRHEVLRTIYTVQGGEPKQLIMLSSTFTLDRLGLDGQPAAEQKALNAASSEVQRPFSLTTGPLLRALLIRISATRHLFVLTFHHSISDGWSIGILNRELAEFYAARINHRPPNLPELPIQYADYAVWQRAYLKGEVLNEQLTYWRDQLAGVPTFLALPTDRPRPAVQTFQGDSVDMVLPPDLVATLKDFSQREGATLFMTLLAGFQVLLSRYSGQDDIVVGTPVAGRTRAELEGLIGFFVNTLPLRTRLDGNPSFRELLHRVRDVALGAYAHQDLPFEKLVEELRPERSLESNPLFQVLINWNIPETSFLLPHLTTEAVRLGSQSTRFPLTLYIQDLGSQLALRLLYQTDLFTADRIREMMNQFIYFLNQVGYEPDKSIHMYSLVTSTAFRVLPDPLAPLDERYYSPTPAVFLDCANRMPHLPAIRQGENTWTYEEIAQSVGALAKLIRKTDIGRGKVVALTGPRSCGYMVGMLAILLAGGVILTLDSRLPILRKRRMLSEAQCQFVLETEQDTSDADWLNEAGIGLLEWHQPDPGKCEFGVITREMEDLCSKLDPADPAYVFFTSGTTGLPKGILGCHKGLSHFLTWQRDHFEIGPHDRSAQLTGLSFDVVLRDIFLPLTSGAVLCLPDDPDDLGADHILPWLEREQITLLHTVPTIANSWLACVPFGISLRSLRQVFFAGEPLSDTLVARWRATFPESGRLANLYGPTETSLAKLCYEIPDQVSPGVQPVGWPLPETQALVLGTNGQLCALAEPGEIVIRTPYRSLGYIGTAAEDRDRFVRNHFRDDENDILYFTGDRGRYRNDGALEILGRLDDQIKIRGIRVEPSEVAMLLTHHPLVRECVVIGCENREAEKYLAAYIVPAPDLKVTVEEMRSFLAENVPQYMVPSAFVFLSHLPLTANGKVDRQALPAPTLWETPGGEFDTLTTSVEITLGEIWKNALGIKQIRLHDNFFELGGHSLLATSVMGRVRDTFKVDLPLRVLFEMPTVARLASAIQNAPKQQENLLVEPIRPVPRELRRSPNTLWSGALSHQMEKKS